MSNINCNLNFPRFLSYFFHDSLSREWSRECTYWCFCWYNQIVTLIFWNYHLASSVSNCIGLFISSSQQITSIYSGLWLFARRHHWSYNNSPWCHEDKIDGSGEYLYEDFPRKSPSALLTMSILVVIAGTREPIHWNCKLCSDNPQRGGP